MDFVTIALIIAVAAIWITLLVVVVAVCKASGRADADEERYLVMGRDGVLNRPPAQYSGVAVGDERTPVDAAELEREARRLGIALPERRHPHLPRLIGTHRHRS